MLLKCCLIHISTIILRHFFIFTIFVSMSRPRSIYVQKQPPRAVPRKRCSENIQQIYRRTPVPECGLNKVAKQLYWNRTSAWVFSSKFVTYFQNTFFQGTPQGGCFYMLHLFDILSFSSPFSLRLII